jgi:adapter protein MecA 1/2
MEMEKINDNTIRVLLENKDLTERGITVLDLLGNHKEIENFFYSILEEVDVDHEFRENDAVTFQLLPNRNGLELFISKVSAKDSGKKNDNDNDDSDNEDDDINFSLVNDQNFNNYLDDANLDSFKDNKKTAIKDDGDGISGYLDDKHFKREHYVFKFQDFEDFVMLSKILKNDDLGSSLYLLDKGIYLDVVFFPEQVENMEIDDTLALIDEFGERVKLRHDLLEENGKCLLKSSAFELARYYFK